MNVEQLDKLFQEYGYEAKEQHNSYRVYVLNQGMYHGAEIIVLDDSNVDHILARYSKLGYHAKEQRFKSVEEAEYYLFKGFFNTQTTQLDINKRYSDYAASQVKHYCDTNIKYQYISMPYSVYGEESKESTHGIMNIISAIMQEINKELALLSLKRLQVLARHVRHTKFIGLLLTRQITINRSLLNCQKTEMPNNLNTFCGRKLIKKKIQQQNKTWLYIISKMDEFL